MTIITLIFTNPDDTSRVIKKKISWDALFGRDSYSEEFTFSRLDKIKVTYLNNLLIIETQSKVDVFININAAPLAGMYVKTKGVCVIAGAMNLDLGLLVIASDIDLDAPIISPGFIALDTSDNPNGKVHIDKKITVDNIGILTNRLQNESHVSANQALIFCKRLIIEALGYFSIGNLVSFNKSLKDINPDALVTWNMISTSQKIKQFSQEIRYICADNLINKGTLKLRGVELHVADDLTHASQSKTTYEDVKIFNLGNVNVCEYAVVDGKNTFLKSDKVVNLDGEININVFAMVCKMLNTNGILWGGERLDVQVVGDTVCNGIIGSEHTNLISNSILVTLMRRNINDLFGAFKKGGIVGAKSLNINALGMLVAGGGYLYSPSVQSRTAFYANFAGMVCAFNFVNRSIFMLDFGLNAPCSPSSLSDLLNWERMLRLSCRVMSNSFPMLRNAATFGTLAAPLGKFIKSTVTSAAKQSSNIAHSLYEDPKKQFHNVVSASNDLKNSVSEFSKAGVETISNAAKQVSSSSKEDFILKAKESMKQVSEAWNRTRWLDLLNYLLTMQDWYISADMIMMQGTSALVFANDVKICLKSPSATLEGIANNFSTMFNSAKSTLGDPNFSGNVYNASMVQVDELKAIPKKAVDKLYARSADVVAAVTNPLEAANKISGSLANAVNSITLENAKKGMLDPLLKKKNNLLEASNNLCFGSDQVLAANEVNCDIPPAEAPLTSNIEEDPDHASIDTQDPNDVTTINASATLEDNKMSPFKQTVLDVAVMFAPSIYKSSAVSTSAGITIAGAVMEDNLLNSHNGVTAAISSSNYSLFGFHNSGGIYSNYRNEFVGNRYNTGDVHVGAMHLNAGNNEEHGDFKYSEFIFDIARDFNTIKKTRMSEAGHIQGTVNGNFYGASDFSMRGGKFAINGNYIIEQGATHTIGGGSQFSAKNADVYGCLNAVNGTKVHFYNGIVHNGGKYSINGAIHTGNILTFKPGSMIDMRNDLINVNTLDDQGANVYAENHITFAKQFTRVGNWTYKGFLHEQLDKITTASESTLQRSDTDAEYSIDAKEADFNGAEKHSRVLANISGMTAPDAVDYGLGRGKYSNIEVAEDIEVSSETTENAEYAGSRVNGARVQVQTNGRITLPPQYDRARGMTFANYEEADYFIRAVYATHNLPPPQPKKRHGIKKHLDKVSDVFATVAAVFANGKDPITLAISAVSAGIAIGTDQLDKHYGRKDIRYLEQLELERAGLQQKLDLEGLSMQEKNFLASLTNQDHMRRVNSAVQRLQNVDDSNYNDVISNTWSLGAAKQQAVQQFADSRQEMNAKNARQLGDISYHHARARDNISRSGGPVIGAGFAINAGSTGVTTSLTFTTGNPGKTVTGRIPIANRDFNRPVIENAQDPELLLQERPRIREKEPLSPAEAERVSRALEDRFPGIHREQEPIPQLVPLNFGAEELLVLSANPGQSRDNISANSSSNLQQLTDRELQGAVSALQAATNQLNDRSYLESPEMQYRTTVSVVANNIVSHNQNQFEEKPLMQVLFAAIDGNMSAKKEMRKRATTLAKFFDSIDPELRIKASDSAVMAELKMYGRAAKGLRDQFIHTVKNLDELVTGPFILGADIIEAGLYYYGGKAYYPAARERNYDRIAAVDQLLHADGITQREAILTMGLAAMAGGIIMAPSITVIQMPSKSILSAFRLRTRTAGGQANLVQSARLANELELRSYQWSCKSMFTKDGKLQHLEIYRSKIISWVKDYHKESPAYMALSKLGDINDWAKCYTREFYTYNSSSGKQLMAEIHFYRNQKTAEAYYGLDYKVKLKSSGQPQIPVKEFLKLSPKEWRPKL